MKFIDTFFVCTIAIFTLTVLILRKLIPYLASKHIGQKILEIGPRWHKNKEGTPTMGGISFIISGISVFIVFVIVMYKQIPAKQLLLLINVMIYALLNGMIGIIDDIAKIRRRQNEGLTPSGKFMLQALFSILFLVSLYFTVGLNTRVEIPFTKISIELGVAYYLLAFLMLCGTVNSVNLTDGIDGLAASIVFTVGVFIAAINKVYLDNSALLFISALIIGSSLGFLVYNFYPAKIFMGDTGSLYFGGLIAASPFLLGNILFVLIYGFVFIAEAASDILQVGYYKISKGKRIFKMAPLHHHFEKCGWSEIKIVTVFCLINIIFCVIAFIGFGL
jgi:phospho-N-acetylmuramoyl-pentapeptide-transferase